MTYRDVQHLWMRAGFGGTPSQIKYRVGWPKEKLVTELFDNSKDYKLLQTIKDPVRGKEASNLSILFLILKSKGQLNQLNLDWLKMLSVSKASLRERMTFFWHNHFATSTPLAWLMQNQNNMIRENALGSFRSLLHSIAKDPAMIVYLNNQQNKKEKPNENFAREVMELFTLGRDIRYDENDIKEAARAFTGWHVNKRGEFEKNLAEHDDGPKTFMGKTGNFDGEDIIDIILEQQEVAIYIATKVYKEFVNVKINNNRVDEIAQVFYNSNYSIKAMMEYVYLSEWFYSSENYGAHILSPVELIVRYHKLISLETRRDQDMIRLQQFLGQVLMFPPNVAGWPGGKAWVDASSLTTRLSIPQSVLYEGGIEIKPKPSNEDDPLIANELKTDKRASVRSDWNTLVNHFMSYPKEEVLLEISQQLLQVQPTEESLDIIKQFVDNSTKERQIITFCAAVMSLPEFQLG